MADIVAEMQKASSETANHFGGEMSQSLQAMRAVLDSAMSNISQHQQDAASRNDAQLAELDTRIEKLVSSVQSTNQSLTENISMLNKTSIDVVNGMNQGAEKMRLAADSFTSAGDTVTGAMSRGGEVFERVAEVAKGMDSAGQAMRDTVTAYTQTTGSLEAMTESLRNVAHEANQRADVSKSLLDDMEMLVGRFQETHGETRTYLEGVSEVLAESFDAFNSAVQSSLETNRGTFDKSLSTAVGMLGESLSELEGIMSDFRAKASV